MLSFCVINIIFIIQYDYLNDRIWIFTAADHEMTTQKAIAKMFPLVMLLDFIKSLSELSVVICR